MRLEELARQAAEDIDGDLHKDLSARSPLNAVIECAHRAGVISESSYHALLHMDAEGDFSLFVRPNDTLVMHVRQIEDDDDSPHRRFREHRVAAHRVPAGVFLAFIRVAQHVDKRYLARRYLVHPMISLGDGKAAGCDVAQIGVRSNSTAWRIIDLERDLVWLDTVPTNRYDVLSRYSLGVKKVELLRLRYRRPTFGATGPVAEQNAWGQLNPSSQLRNHIVNAAKAVTDIRIEAGNGNVNKPPDEHVFRVNLRFGIGEKEFDSFFNSPNEMRGHYYVDAAEGDAYTRRLLEAIADAIDWQAQLLRLDQSRYFGRSFDRHNASKNHKIVDRIKASLHAGKIWYREKQSCVMPDPRWHWDWSKHKNRYPFAPNTRWIGSQRVSGANWRAFLEDTGADRGVMSQDEFRVLKEKLDDAGLGIARSGSSYYRCMTPAEIERHGVSPDNLDVKGDWVTPRGKLAGFVPADKRFRGHQIKWFGFT